MVVIELHPLCAFAQADLHGIAADRLLIAGTETDTTALNQLNVTLKNSSTPILPTTGGMGTALFTVGGVALMAVAAWLFFRRKEKKD